jgi:hypothetical protein
VMASLRLISSKRLCLAIPEPAIETPRHRLSFFHESAGRSKIPTQAKRRLGWVTRQSWSKSDSSCLAALARRNDRGLDFGVARLKLRPLF